MKFIVSSILLIASIGWAQSNAALGMKDNYTALEPAKTSTAIPQELEGVGIEEKIGQKIDLTTLVKNEKGESVPLSSFFKAHHPVIFSPVYFNCPGLCNFHLNAVVDILKTVDWSPGNQFDVVAFGFDAKENYLDAAKKKEMYLKIYQRPGTENGWHFVTSDEATIKKITEQIGFKFKWNDKVSEWSHASAAIVISPDGTISRYLHGIQFESRDVKLALNEAADGKVGNIADSVMLFCFKYDRHQSKYGLQVFRVMQLGGAATIVMLALWLIPVIIRAKRENS
ncbi:MAG: SCO family protein [Pseudobdellovibrio sp.]